MRQFWAVRFVWVVRLVRAVWLVRMVRPQITPVVPEIAVVGLEIVPVRHHVLPIMLDIFQVCSEILSKMRCDRRTAAAAIDTLWAPISVVLRTSFATAKLRWNSWCR